MRFNLLRSTTAWVCLLGLTLFAHATLADSSFSSGNAVSAGRVKVKHASVDDGTILNAGRRSHEHKNPSIDNGFIVEAHDAHSHKTSSVDDAIFNRASANDRTSKPISVNDGTLATTHHPHAHEHKVKDSEAKSIRTLLTPGVDVLAAKRVIDTKTRALGQVSEASGTAKGLEPAKRGKYWCMLCQCC